MSALSINPPFPVFPDTDGQPLEDGYIWIGTAGLNPLTNPIVVYWDAALTLPAGQPVRTINGFPSRAGTPARLYAGSDYSIQVQNKNGSVTYSAPNATERISGAVISTIDSSKVEFLQSGTGAVVRTVQSKLRESVSVKDFGAVGDGVTDDTNAFILAANAIQAAGGGKLIIPNGTYLVFKQGTTYSQFPCVFTGLSNVVVDFSEATIQVDPAKIWTGSNAALFRFTDCSDICVYGGNFVSPAVALDGTFTGVEVVSLRGDCRGVTIPYLRVQNALAAVLISNPATSAGSRNIWIGTVEATGSIYGINCANSGSNMVVDNLVTSGCGRSFFIYGTSHVKANIRSKNFKFSADAAVATITNGFNSINDIEINYNNTESDPASSVGVGVRLAHSFAGGVAGNISNFRCHLQVNLEVNTGIASAFEYSKDDAGGNPDPTDRGHIMTNVKVSGVIYGTPSFGASVQFGRNGTVFGNGESFYQIDLEDIRVLNTTSQSISIERIMPSMKGNLYLNKIQAITDINVWGGANPATYTSIDAGARFFVSDVNSANIDSYNVGTSVNGVKTFVAVTSPVTVRQQYSGLIMTNQFSGGTVVYDLPAAVPGLQYGFAQVSANLMRIDPNGAEIIRGGGAGKYLELGAAGTSVTIFCRAAGIWEIIQSNGTTSFEP